MNQWEALWEDLNSVGKLYGKSLALWDNSMGRLYEVDMFIYVYLVICNVFAMQNEGQGLRSGGPCES